jgi:hypothetical protein
MLNISRIVYEFELQNFLKFIINCQITKFLFQRETYVSNLMESIGVE